jgi:hypothetical protein
MLLRVFDVVGFDYDALSWDASPENLPTGLADIIQGAAVEMKRRVGTAPPWSTVFEKAMKEYLVLVRAWENAADAADADTAALGEMIAERIDGLDEMFRIFVNSSL